MRKALAALIALAAALVVAPAPAATSAPGPLSDRADRAPHALRVVTVRDRVILITNNKRRAHGCRDLAKNRFLGKAAQQHTKRMANSGAGGTLSHQLPREANYAVRIRRAGYRNATETAENVASFYATPSAVVRAWMASPGHRANILNCRLEHIGVGFARASNGTPYWTQDFGRR